MTSDNWIDLFINYRMAQLLLNWKIKSAAPDGFYTESRKTFSTNLE